MGDFSNYAEQGMHFGKTVPYEVTELVNADGTHPIVHLEHLGETNISLVEESLAQAGSEQDAPADTLARLASSQETVIKHSAKRIERVFFADGTPATDADIAGFIRSMPPRTFHRLLSYAMNAANFYKQVITSDPGALAEK